MIQTEASATLKTAQYTRSPYQVALLTVATFGFYMVFWIARNRWIAEDKIGQRHRPWWSWFGLVIPILNVALILAAADVIEKGVRSRRSRGPIPFWLYLLIGAPTGLNVWFLPLIQCYIYNADVMTTTPAPKAKLSPIEIAILVVGFILEVLAILGEFANDATQGTGAVLLFLAAWLFVILPFAIVTQRIKRAAERAAQRTCPWCLASIARAAFVCKFCQREVGRTSNPTTVEPRLVS